MTSAIKVKDIIDNFEGKDFEIVKKYEVVDAMWGIGLIKITDKDIEALKNGEYLYSNDGECAQVICYEKSESEDETETDN